MGWWSKLSPKLKRPTIVDPYPVFIRAPDALYFKFRVSLVETHRGPEYSTRNGRLLILRSPALSFLTPPPPHAVFCGNHRMWSLHFGGSVFRALQEWILVFNDRGM